MYSRESSSHLACATSELKTLSEKLTALTGADEGLTAQLDGLLTPEKLNAILKSHIDHMAQAHLAVARSLLQLETHFSACSKSLGSLSAI